MQARSRRRGGFGFWVIAIVVLISMIFVASTAAYFQNQTLNRSLVDSYIGRTAVNIAVSAIEEGYYRLHRHTLSPEVDPSVRLNWETVFVSVPGARPEPQVIVPEATKYYFSDPAFAPTDYTVEEISNVTMTLVDWAWNVGAGFWSGVCEFECRVRLKVGPTIGGVAVARTVRIRKRWYAAQSSAVQSPDIRYLPEDVSKEIVRN